MKKRLKQFITNNFKTTSIGIWVLSLIVLIIATLLGGLLIPYAVVSNLCGNICAGLIASLVILIYSSSKDSTKVKAQKAIDEINHLLTRITDCRDKGRAVGKSIREKIALDIVQENLRIYHGYYNGILEFQHRPGMSQYYKAAIKDEGIIISSLQVIGDAVIYTTLKQDDVPNVEESLRTLQDQI